MNFSCIWSLAWKIASSLKRAFGFYYRLQLYYDECKWMIIFTRDFVHFNIDSLPKKLALNF